MTAPGLADLNPLSVACPFCRAKAGERCVRIEWFERQLGYAAKPHPSRVKRADNQRCKTMLVAAALGSKP